MLSGKGAASAMETSESRSGTSDLKSSGGMDVSGVQMGRAFAWHLFGMSEALLSAIYDLKLPDAW
jgi:hypothetical protein